MASDEQIAEARRLCATRAMTGKQIAAALGVSTVTLWKWGRRYRLRVPTRSLSVGLVMASLEHRNRISRAMRASWDRRKQQLAQAALMREHKAVEIPAWVPASLRAEYRELAVQHGEEQAASRVRRLKREMQHPDMEDERCAHPRLSSPA